ncbi:unnamed protein product [Citrullus colocynthis]|uniref:Uncharacterized protein n=1 Tax=Citrullus colocynthis TaxID=252529 RepID=A0ABP0XKF3_9ROSI
MDHKPDHKAPRPNDRNNLDHHHKMSFTEFNLEELKQTPNLLISPPSRSMVAPKAPSSVKGNCLCSPTTHIGSFRCRHHRHTGMIRGGSVGSNLSDLARKSTEIMGPYSP